MPLMSSMTYFKMDDGTLYIRPVKRDDKAQIMSLYDRCFPVKYSESFYDSAVSEMGAIFHCVCCIPDPNQPDREIVIGSITWRYNRLDDIEERQFIVPMSLFARFFEKTKYLACILTLAVDNAYRGRGVAKLLVQTCMERSRQYGCHAVYLHVLISNMPAIAFYERSGFTKRCICPNYYHIHGTRANAFLYAVNADHFDTMFDQHDDVDKQTKSNRFIDECH